MNPVPTPPPRLQPLPTIGCSELFLGTKHSSKLLDFSLFSCLASKNRSSSIPGGVRGVSGSVRGLGTDFDLDLCFPFHHEGIFARRGASIGDRIGSDREKQEELGRRKGKEREEKREKLRFGILERERKKQIKRQNRQNRLGTYPGSFGTDQVGPVDSSPIIKKVRQTSRKRRSLTTSVCYG